MFNVLKMDRRESQTHSTRRGGLMGRVAAGSATVLAFPLIVAFGIVGDAGAATVQERWASVKSADPKLAELGRAQVQVAKYMKSNGLRGTIEKGVDEDSRIQAHEVMVVVDSEADLREWAKVSRPFQLKVVEGIHDHAAFKPITDAVHYVVIRRDGAEGIIGGAAKGGVQPITEGWALWVRWYPEGYTLKGRPPSDKDLVPGRLNSLRIADRPGQRPMTGSYVPHQQLTQVSPPEVRAAVTEFLKTGVPDTITGKSKVSDSTTFALHLTGKPLAPDCRPLMPFPGGAEIGHVHEDGSLHVALSPEDRWEVMAKGWGEPHPAARWGVNAIMIYAPRNLDEVETVKKVIKASYGYAIGEVTK